MRLRICIAWAYIYIRKTATADPEGYLFDKEVISTYSHGREEDGTRGLIS
jgi:hypothetical protein